MEWPRKGGRQRERDRDLKKETTRARERDHEAIECLKVILFRNIKEMHCDLNDF